MKLEFTKMEGCGNDYLYVNGFTQQIPEEKKPGLVRRLSDRHFGVGGDGVIFINPAPDGIDFEMEMYNADGSRGEMCGNGIRCVAKYVSDHGMTDRDEISVVSAGAVKYLTLYKDAEGLVETVRVNMGAPVLHA
ncbi:MAG: diaminopimelate epimerase, partial [Lachnospiraceae bacterium]|nr:diaminopimelate epimerase [Lachnospiraceae bacterium]